MPSSKRPLSFTAAELQEMAKTSTMQSERRLLWEVSRLRKIVLQAHELDILLTDEKMLNRDPQLAKVAGRLRELLKDEPVIAESIERHGIYLDQQRM